MAKNELVQAFWNYRSKVTNKPSEPHLFESLRECQVEWLQAGAPELTVQEAEDVPGYMLIEMYGDILKLGPDAHLVNKFIDKVARLVLATPKNQEQRDALNKLWSSPVKKMTAQISFAFEGNSGPNPFLTSNIQEAIFSKVDGLPGHFSAQSGTMNVVINGSRILAFNRTLQPYERDQKLLVRACLPHLLEFLESDEGNPA